MICCKWESSTLNTNFTRDEIEAAIDYLKCKKSPGVDNIPAAFVKSCKDELANDLVDVFYYIIEKRNFPDRWTEGILSAVYKSGSKRSVNDFRGITMLQVMEKVFEIMVYTVFFKTRGHLSRLAWPTQRDGLSCLASPRLALRCAAWPGKTNPDPCYRPVATSGCSHRYYNDIVHNVRCFNIPFFSVRQVVFLYKHECLK